MSPFALGFAASVSKRIAWCAVGTSRALLTAANQLYWPRTRAAVTVITRYGDGSHNTAPGGNAVLGFTLEEWPSLLAHEY